MPGTELDWALYRLPDGSVRRRAEQDTAAALAATDLIHAAAAKAAEALCAASLASVQRATAHDLADRYRGEALDVVEKADATAVLARRELAVQEAAAAAELDLAQMADAQELEAAEVAAAAALQEFEVRLSATSDVASSRLLAAEELAAARQRAAIRRVAARRHADSQLAASARLTASQVAAAEQAARAAQARELAAAQVAAADELAAAQVVAADELAAAQVAAADDLASVALEAAKRLASAREEAAGDLATAEEQFRLVMDWAGVAACTVSSRGQFLRVNKALCELLDRSEDELLGATLQDVTHPDDVAALVALVKDLVAGQRAGFRTLGRYLASDGRVIWGDLTIAAVLRSDGTVAFHIAQIVDVTERMDHESALLAMATHDSLTGLANRAAMLLEVNRALSSQRRTGRSTAVLVMDLDHFKNVNDSRGHEAGDELLKAAGKRVESVSRGSDLAARMGGDEFVLVMRDLDDPTDAVRAASRLVEAFRRPFLSTEGEFYATASVGVAIATDITESNAVERAVDAGDLLREADTAMYVAKAEGRDRLSVYNEDLRAIVSARLAVESDLRHALERHQLAVWYQPEIDLKTGSVIAVEALLRWHHPDGTVWTADRFIDVAEDTGLILDIGDWVLHQACRQAAAWAAGPGRPVTVRVNKSALQIAEAGMLRTLDDALAASGLDPALLCIEITETALLRQTATVSTNLAGIHERGASIAIDDFGTGYASLTYLRRYRFDVIKIDRSFVTNITTSEQDRSIATGIIALANALGMTVTAEGVEHGDEATCLRGIGCPGAQGWLYSKAVPAGDVTPLLDYVYPHS
jgi:diguanylate cyclase (GGDEF)-like protein/PAS domain S-box-containing protein